MKVLRNLTTIAVLTTLTAATGYSQAQPRSGDRTKDQVRQTDMDRTVDRDRLMDRDRDMDRTQDRLNDADRDRLRDQDRDRIYAADLMTEQERTEYQNQLRELATDQERVEFRLKHQAEMQARAKQRGVSPGVSSTRAQIEEQERARQTERQQIFGYSLMKQDELDRYREQLRVAKTEQERETIRAAHRSAMQQRAREQGVTLPAVK
jgi:hypothetical protein